MIVQIMHLIVKTHLGSKVNIKIGMYQEMVDKKEEIMNRGIG